MGNPIKRLVGGVQHALQPLAIQAVMPWEVPPLQLDTPQPKHPEILKGPQLYSQYELLERTRALLARRGATFQWPLGPFLLPHPLLYGHVLLIGVTGSGKSTLINQIAKGTLEHVGHKHGHRACFWDYRGETLQYLAGLGLWGTRRNPATGRMEEGPLDDACPVHYINLADKRGVGIDIAKDVRNELDAEQFAIDMISPGGNESDKDAVWVEAARNSLVLVVQFLQNHAGTRWQLIDVVEALFYSKNLKRILHTTREGRALWEDSFGTEGQSKGILLNVQSFARKLRPFAAAMTRKPLVSLSEWVTGRESIMVIGNNTRQKKALAPLQRWIFGQVARTVLMQEMSDTKRYLFFLDEIRHAPFGEELNELATNGRAKGACIIAGLQDRNGFMEELGDNNAKEVMGMFGTLVFLKLQETDTAEWASKYFGSHLRIVEELSLSEGEQDGESEGWQVGGGWGPGGGNSSWGQNGNRSKGTNKGRSLARREVERRLVFESEFRSLNKAEPLAPDGLVVEAYYSIPGAGDGMAVAGNMEKRSIRRVPSIATESPVDNSALRYEWGAGDVARLGGALEIQSALSDADVPAIGRNTQRQYVQSAASLTVTVPAEFMHSVSTSSHGDNNDVLEVNEVDDNTQPAPPKSSDGGRGYRELGPLIQYRGRVIR